MSHNEFRQPVSVEVASQGRLCEWCGKPAVHQLTTPGGTYHSEGGFFCQACCEEFVRTVAESLIRVITADEYEATPA